MDIKEDPDEAKSMSVDDLKYLKWIKMGTRFVVGTGVSHVIYGAIETSVEDDNWYQRTATFVGKVAIGMVVGEVIKSNVDKKIDNAAEWYIKNVKEPLADK